MFKSVFAKYITVFMAIILVSFIVLIAFITTTVNNYSVTSRNSQIEDIAHATVNYLEEKLKRTEINDFSTFVVINETDVNSVLRAFTSNSSDISVFFTDVSGNIVYYSDQSENIIKADKSISKELMDELVNGVEVSRVEYLEGIFEDSHMIYAVPVANENDYVCGTVFVCSSSVKLDELLDSMIKTILVASLWIMILALVAVYFITEMVIGPLKKMSVAAKSFAAGKFNVRVPVKGNDEVAQLATAFNHMAESLENLENMRNTFMANVSHDLRTPMTTISGFIDGILAGAIPPEKHEYYLGVIANEVRRLSRLVASLLDISRMQAGDRKFTMAPFDICEMARQIVISFEQKIEEKKLDVEFNCDDDNMTVNADRDAIYQILYNICDNAVKFSKEKGLLKLSINNVKDKKILISVYNEGQGIESADLPFVFERFYKSDKSRGLDKTGVGLGMFIAKTIINAHNQEIWVKSEYGEYCEFGFTLEAVTETAHVRDLKQMSREG